MKTPGSLLLGTTLLASALTVGCFGSTDTDETEEPTSSFVFPLGDFGQEVSAGNASWDALTMVIVGTRHADGVSSDVWVSMNGDGVIAQWTMSEEGASGTARTWGDAEDFHDLLEACASNDESCKAPDDDLMTRWQGYEWSMMLGNDVTGFYEESASTAVIFLPLIEGITG